MVSGEVLSKKMNTNRSTSTPPAARRLSVDSRTQVNNQILSPERPTEISRQQPWAGGISCRTFRDGSKIQQRPSSTLKTRASIDRTSSIRRHISLSIKQPHTPPPLCSVCKHAAPVFGKPPRKFSYEDIQKATNVFSPANYLAEGGFGPVYRGVLEDGQVVAVKKHKKASAQGAAEFCSEVEVLSCAQHRNLVMLVGYCMDDDWLLVYEYACNGSLDKHLYGIQAKEVMPWHHRQKVAMGAARGLRYLHEDCRVGCIIHRDLRPNNILLTHDFEPMVGDFGLARWQANGQSAEETRIVGTFGYLAPEYTQTGQITEKADVYAFGVLLLELISGVKAIDLARGTGQQYLPQWARPLMEMNMIHELIDPRLNGNYVKWEVECMIYASSLCLLSDPEMRPRMSKVLRILEGDMGSKLPAIIPQQHVSMPQFPFPPYHHPPVPLQSSHHPHHHHHHHHSIPTFKPTTRSSHPQIQNYPYAFNEVDMIDQTRNTLTVHNQNENNLNEEYQDYLQGLFDEFLHKARHLSSLSTDDSATPRARRIY
ncbi:inactive protein kinase SELMODRAFT_444075-like [Dioscorea cayenensis subsp. rotundata]|uniref:Inactive protein kinase SELMODRAFT_444075-like n=1 Tax=Dioscorea cayennensis subsp. rotundata TaxID=55577 RepID=A0AB40B6C2_DIOCR|nr:inactive protein kinase SELMODRAFT_444075-like [Dioscorea cayenensis subsp. rotundata]